MFTARRVFLLAGLPLALAATLRVPAPPANIDTALHWRSVGPFTGGRVTTVAGIADQPNVFYMGTAGGGVWETDDYGATWQSISDKDIKTGAIGAIAIAPSNPKIIYVGTGDSAPRNTVLTGDGMYKSTDGGKTWAFIGLGDTHIISLDPRGSRTIPTWCMSRRWVICSRPIADRGVFKTTRRRPDLEEDPLYVDDETGAIAMAMDPSNANVVYASMWQMSRNHWTFSSGGPGSGIYKTTDGGATWTNISHRPGLPAGIFGQVGHRGGAEQARMSSMR